MTVEVLDEEALAERVRRHPRRRQGLGRPPRLVELTYAPRARAHLALVGKGITFDSGGLTIKPAEGMSR